MNGAEKGLALEPFTRHKEVEALFETLSGLPPQRKKVPGCEGKEADEGRSLPRTLGGTGSRNKKEPCSTTLEGKYTNRT